MKMKMYRTYDNIHPWKIDSPIERFLGKWADHAGGGINLGKKLYVQLYKLADKDYYSGGLKMIQKESDRFRVALTEAMVLDMVYSLHRFGSRFDDYFLFNFSELNISGREKYITDKLRYEYYHRMNDEGTNIIFDDKYQSYLKFREYYKRDLVLIEHIDDYSIFCNFVQKYKRVIIKPIDSSCGNGVHIITNEEISKTQFSEYLTCGAFVVEELIVQDEALHAFNPTSVNTVRAHTFKTKDRVVFPYAYLRMGSTESCTDNYCNGGIGAIIDVNTGIIAACGYDHNNHAYMKHPVTQKTIPGFQVPHWEELKELVVELANVVDGCRHVGWDLALTKDGWVMVEGNRQGTFTPVQQLLKYGIKEEVDHYISLM